MKYLDNEKAEVISSAALQAAKILRLSDADFADVLGVKVKFLADFRKNIVGISSESVLYRNIVNFIQLLQSLSSIVGSNPRHLCGWFYAFNSDLHGVPAELIKNYEGLHALVAYLDGHKHYI